MKIVELAPTPTATEEFTVAFELFDARLMVSPPGGAGELRVMVPVEDPPPPIEVGLSVML